MAGGNGPGISMGMNGTAVLRYSQPYRLPDRKPQIVGKPPDIRQRYMENLYRPADGVAKRAPWSPGGRISGDRELV